MIKSFIGSNWHTLSENKDATHKNLMNVDAAGFEYN